VLIVDLLSTSFHRAPLRATVFRKCCFAEIISRDPLIFVFREAERDDIHFSSILLGEEEDS
jgi:hypothetical protein